MFCDYISEHFRMIYKCFGIMQKRHMPLCNKLSYYRLQCLMVNNRSPKEIRQKVWIAYNPSSKINSYVLGIWETQRNYSCHYSKNNLSLDNGNSLGNIRLVHTETNESSKHDSPHKTLIHSMDTNNPKKEIISELILENEDKKMQKTSIPLSFDDFLKRHPIKDKLNKNIKQKKSENDIVKYSLSDEEKKNEKKSNLNNEKSKLSTDLQNELQKLENEGFSFDFHKKLSPGKKHSELVCPICEQKGHLELECPSPLPKMQMIHDKNKKYMAVLTEICTNVFVEHRLRDEEMKLRQDIVNDLNEFLKLNYDKDVRLELFGSSCHGFGFRNSDLDICLTFANNKTEEGLYSGKIIETIADKLKQHKDLKNVSVASTALVPIVEFTHQPSNLESDVCVSSLLPFYKTRLLKTYSEIDLRVKILGCVMKYFAQVCRISNPLYGGMPSFVYILMVIHYLQQRKPPVVPVLQELHHKSKPRPENFCEGWNAWFFEDIKNLKTVWPEYGKNKDTVGELWLGLLRFYTEEFNFNKHVITVSQLAPLSRFEKQWMFPKILAIEDPFDLNYNHGTILTFQMNRYIKRVLIEGRNAFGHPSSNLNSLIQNL